MEQAIFSNESRQPQFLAGLIVCVIMLITSVTARLYAQHSIHHLWALDNLLITIASVFTCATIISCFVGVHYGMGLHPYRIIREGSGSPENLIRVAKTVYISTIVQGPALNITKMSILAFYHRIFTSNRARHRIFKYALIVIGTFLIIFTIATTPPLILQCQPIHGFWDPSPLVYALMGQPDHPTRIPRCISSKAGYGVGLITGLVIDVIILCLPALGLWNLQLRIAQKVAIFASLSLGVFACIVEVLRIRAVFNTTAADQATPPTYGDGTIWTAVELTVAETCACIPACAPLLRKAQEGSKHLARTWSSWVTRTMPISTIRGYNFRRRKNYQKQDTDSLTELSPRKVVIGQQEGSLQKPVGVGISHKVPTSSQILKSQDLVAAAEDFKNGGHVTRDDFVSDEEESRIQPLKRPNHYVR